MTTKAFPEEESIISDNKKRRRQSQERRKVVGNDALPIFLYLLVLFSRSHLPKCDAFPLPPMNKIVTTTPTRRSQSTTNKIFLGLERRNRQKQFHCYSTLSLQSQSIDGRSDSNDGNEITEKKKSDSKELPSPDSAEVIEPSPATIAEANALRARAEELRAEARAMELELRQQASKQQREKDAVTDEMIATLFLPLQYQDPQLTVNSGGVESGDKHTPSKKSSPTAAAAATIPDARVVADRLRQGKFSRQQIMAVVDRLYEQHHDTNENEGGLPVTNTSESQRLEGKEQQHLKQGQRGVSGGETAIPSGNGRYSDYFHVLVQAAVLLDESIVANTLVEDTPKTTKSTAIQTGSVSPEATSSSASPVSLSSSSSSLLSSFNFSSSASSPSSAIPTQTSFVTSGQIGKAIQSRIGELQKLKQAELNRRIAAETNRIATMSPSSGWSQEYSGSSNNGTSVSSTGKLSGETPAFVPLWIPSTYIPYILSLDDKSTLPSPENSSSNSTQPVVPFAVIRNSSLEATELEILKEKVLLGSRFYMTSFEFAPGAALFRGNMRTSLANVPAVVPSLESNKNRTIQKRINNNTAMVFADIQDRLEAAGLRDKVQLFVLPDPEATIAQSSRTETRQRPHIESSLPHEEDPVILALPKKLTPDESKLEKGWIRKVGKRLSYPIAILSTFFYSLKAFALNPNFFDALVNRRDATVLYSCIPLALGFLSVQLIHEVAHYWVAKRKKIKIGFPVPISTMFYSHLPFFGCITPLRSFPPNRAALVDFALSGPIASLVVSLCMVFGGVMLTSSASAGQIARFPFLSVHTMKSNFLLGSILSWLLPKTMMLPLAQPIPMHPLFVIGRFGMISSALNLLPIFRLDGGRACFAAMGQRQGAVISAFTILWIISNFFMSSSMLLVWTLIVAVFQMRVEIPCRDECTEVGGKREWLWFISFLISVSILVPFPQHGSFL